MHRPTLPGLAEVLRGARRVLVLEDVVDHTNVGAVFRSAAALGVDAVLVTPRCADPLYRRSVRVSMGTVFQVPWTRVDPWPGGLDVVRGSASTSRRWPSARTPSASTSSPPTRPSGSPSSWHRGRRAEPADHRRGRHGRPDPDGGRSRQAQRRRRRRGGGLGAAGATPRALSTPQRTSRSSSRSTSACGSAAEPPWTGPGWRPSSGAR